METFGRYLVQQRELRGMSRDDVVRVTKLSPSAVDALEQDRFDALPARVFVLGYIRSYASCIGLNPDDAVLRYEEYAQARKEIEGRTPGAPTPALVKRSKRRRGPGTAAAAVGVVVFAGLLLAWWLSG